MNLLGFIMSLVYMQAVHEWLSAYERLVNSQNFFSPYLTQEDMFYIGYLGYGTFEDKYYNLLENAMKAPEYVQMYNLMTK